MFSDSENYKSEKGKTLVHLFTHPKFDSILYPEDDIIKMPIANRYQIFAWQIIHYWEEKGLRRPRYSNREKAYGSALSDLVAVMRGEHPKVHKKLSAQEIMQSINHWELAAHNPMYAPYDKRTIKALDIPRFIYSEWGDHSYLLEYLDPPRTLTKEVNPKLTQLIKVQYSNQRWGELKDNTDTVDHYHFVNASNRVNKYLQENLKRLRLGLSPKNPDRAAYGLVRCASNSKNWNNFNVAWLANDFTFSKFTTWLKDQGFIIFSTKIAQISR